MEVTQVSIDGKRSENVEYHSAIKREEMLPFVTGWTLRALCYMSQNREVKCHMISLINLRQTNTFKLFDTENRLVVALCVWGGSGQNGGRDQKVPTLGYQISPGDAVRTTATAGNETVSRVRKSLRE